ncbi:MAG TPA: transposase, partial [Polyangia bacterium]|nr:transposase [Polyangia bacterium]
MDLTEEQWALIEPLFPEKETLLENGRGRPFRDPRDVFYGVLWVLRTGAPW